MLAALTHRRMQILVIPNQVAGKRPKNAAAQIQVFDNLIAAAFFMFLCKVHETSLMKMQVYSQFIPWEYSDNMGPNKTTATQSLQVLTVE